jgi:hypothetical protein
MTTVEKITDSIAAGALTTPLWLHDVHDIFVSWVVPLLGASWLIVQMYYKIKHERNKD